MGSKNKSFKPLTEAEMEVLDQFLLNRVDQGQWTQEKDEGVFDLSMLDGFFAAIVSGPSVVSPSQWLPSLWGDFEPDWKSEKQFEKYMTLLIRFMNSIATHLEHDPDTFDPMFHSREIEDKEHMIVDEWCEGYMRGVYLNDASWKLDQPLIKEMIAPIKTFTLEYGMERFESINEQAIEELQKMITPNVLAIHAYWLALRSEQADIIDTFQHPNPRPGRNDPCFCGSGKKYKKCCLH